MSRVQSLIQWDIRRGGDVEVLGDLRARPAKERGRRLRELALLGLLAERSGFVLGSTAAPVIAPVKPHVEATAARDPAQLEALDDFMSEMLGSLE